jgi:hypothetical protein
VSTFSNPLTEYSPQLEAEEYLPGGSEYEHNPGDGVFSEEEEMELAAELLEVRDDRELDQFLGDLIGKAAGVLGGLVNSSAGKAIGGVLKNLARKALPLAGGALGGMVGGPLGAQIGSVLASRAGPVLGLELEGLSPEDRQFEATRQFVRFAGATVGNALAAPSGGDPAQAAREAAQEAARLHAPGLMNFGYGPAPASGRWIRRNGRIILLGI